MPLLKHWHGKTRLHACGLHTSSAAAACFTCSCSCPVQGATVSGEGTKAQILSSVAVCHSLIYYISYPLLPSTSLANLPPFTVYTPPPGKKGLQEGA
jgi:hypothetical protein